LYSIGHHRLCLAGPVRPCGKRHAQPADDLFFGPGARLRFSPGHALGVMGKVSFEDDFGIGNLDGLSESAALGSYPLISGNVDTANLQNAGPSRAAPIGPGRWAYLEVNGGLTLNVVDAQASQCLGWIVLRRRLEADGNGLDFRRFLCLRLP
jgi:hypothetical protein